MNKLTKLELAVAVICTVACGVAVVPLIILAIFAFFEVLCWFVCLFIYFYGAIIWLFSEGLISIFSAGTDIAYFGTGLYTWIEPAMNYSCLYITPYAGYVALAVGVPGIIISTVALEIAERKPKMVRPQDAEKERNDKDVRVVSLIVCIVYVVLALIAILFSHNFELFMRFIR